MVQLREGTQKIVDMYNDKNNYKSSYMDKASYNYRVFSGRDFLGIESGSYDEFLESEHSLDNKKFNHRQAIVNHVMKFIERDDRELIDDWLNEYSAPEKSKLASQLLDHIRLDDDSDDLSDIKNTTDMAEFEGEYKKYYVSYSDLDDFDKDLDEQLSDKIADGISMNEVVENFNSLSQTQETGNERVEQLDLNLDGLDNGDGLQR